MKLLDEACDLVLRDHLAVDTDALTEVDKVRRREQAHAIAIELQHRRQHVRDRALAIGSGNVDDAIVAMRMPEKRVQITAGLQSWLIATSALSLKGRALVI